MLWDALQVKLLKLAQKNLEQYISVVDVISILAKTQDTPIKHVGTFLLNQKFDEEIATYSCDKFYIVHDSDEYNWGKFTNTHQILLEIAENKDFEDTFTFNQNNFSTLQNTSYWKRSDLYNLKLFQELSVDFYFRIKEIIELIKNKKLPVEKFENIEELTIDEVKELLGEDHRTYVKKDRENFIISAFVESLQRCFNYFDINSDFDIVIDKNLLKTIFSENGIIINGFNDALDEQVQDKNVWDQDYLSQLESENLDVIDNETDELEFLDIIYGENDFLQENNKQKNYPLFYKNETFTIEEAACLMSGCDKTNIESKSTSVTWRNENSDYVEAEEWILSLLRANIFRAAPNCYVIDSADLKKYLNKIGKIIEGFNDESNLSEVESTLINENNNLKFKVDELNKEVESLKALSSDIGIPSIGHAPPEQYQKQRDELLIEVEKLRTENDELKKKNAELLGIDDEIDSLTGLAKNNQLAQDRNGMARVIASYLWQQDKHKDKLPKDIAELVQKEMKNYCADNEIPKTIATMKKIIGPIVPENVRNLKGRPSSKSNN